MRIQKTLAWSNVVQVLKPGCTAMRNTLLVLPILLSTVGFSQTPGSFAITGSMITPRFGHRSILLPNGKVLIAGGSVIATSSSIIYAGYSNSESNAGGILTSADGKIGLPPTPASARSASNSIANVV